MIKVSRSLKEIAYKARVMKEELMRELDREPTINEIAAGLEMDVTEIVEALEASTDIESLSAVIHQGDGKPITLEDKIDQSPKEQNNMIDNIVLSQMIEDLLPLEREIIVYRYFEDRTQTEIATLLGISQVQVSRIEKRILKKMRGMLGAS
ncbi:MAG: sigma-70 family RNA polymerase sigma factor, partial [Cellulosilyticaceae bacterium]